jgi:hypothetical protein
MKHIQHLLIVAVVGLVTAVAAVTVLSALVPADFGAQPQGWEYRKSSLDEHAKAPPIVYAAEESCSQKNCHGGENAKAGLNVSLGGKHKKIGCQACHGAAQSHVASAGAKDGPTIWKPENPLSEEERAKLPKEELEKLDNARAAFHVGFCLGCHAQAAGKPEAFPQIASFEKHRKANGDGSEAGCTSCHNPHKPTP